MPIRRWFAARAEAGWATCPLTESGFVRVSSNRKMLPSAIGVEAARSVLAGLRAHAGHRFIPDDVSICDADVPKLAGHRHVTDAHLLTLARRREIPLVTFDGALAVLAGNRGVELLSIG